MTVRRHHHEDCILCLRGECDGSWPIDPNYPTGVDWMTKLIDRIAAKLGYERPQPVVTEIVIFASAEEARHCGFRNGGHPEMPHVQAWWPGLGLRGLAMRPIQRVTIPERMLTHQTEEGGLAAILRARQRVFGDRAVWLVLR